MEKLEIVKLYCHRCGHEWWPKIKHGQVVNPIACPKCHNPYWSRLKIKH